MTVFFSGNWLPNKPAGDSWYNLAKLPLKAIRTGSTDVWIETDEAIDPITVTKTLELFAKDGGGDFDPTFRWTAINGGYHHINIVEKQKPAPPIADPSTGTYTSTRSVALTAEPDCKIYYSINGGAYQEYTSPIEVSVSESISTYAERTSDGKRSNTVTYSYHIVPEMPELFIDEGSMKTGIGNYHYETSPFLVYAAVGNVFEPIPAECDVYYTFSETLSADNIAASSGNDPETQWVKIDKSTPSLKEIDKHHTVRLVTIRGEETSDINWYYLGVTPAPVAFTPESGIKDAESVTVGMTSATTGAEIFYTIDGSDPRTSPTAQKYSDGAKPTFADDVSVRAAAKYDELWSEVTTAWYVLEQKNDLGVSAFYPSGVYEGGVEVTLTAQNPENAIKYSTDNGTTWNDYTGTLTLDEDTVILAKAVTPGGTEGNPYTFTYTIRPKPPVFAPESTQFTNQDNITVYCEESTDANTEHYTLYYTVDGTDPTTSATRRTGDAASDSSEITITRYTVVKAAVIRDGTWSSVVTHAYDIVSGKAVSPLMTLVPGFYTIEPGQESYITELMPVPTGTTIYFTTDGTNPDVNDPSQAYTPDTELPVTGHTTIKAIAVDSLGYRSDIAIFDYTITPSAPVAAPSATIGSDTLPVVPVTAVKGATVTYKVNGEEFSFDNVDDTVFYLDTATGIAYRNSDKTSPLVDPTKAKSFSGQAVVELQAELDGIDSSVNTYVYRAQGNNAISAPWADKAAGTYPEIKLDNDGTLLRVALDSLNSTGKIQYRLNNSGDWIDYAAPIKLSYKLNGSIIASDSPITSSGSTVLQARVIDGINMSETVSYVYNFVPQAPVIELPSGRYSYTVDINGVPQYPSTTLSLAPDSVTEGSIYDIFYRSNGDKSDVRYTGNERIIDHTMSFKAYTVNRLTGKLSVNTVHYYIVESPNAISGTVVSVYPYDVLSGSQKDIATHLLDDEEYNEGIKLRTQDPSMNIRYFYTWTGASDGVQHTTGTMTYDPAMPIFVNSSMSKVVVTAWLEDDTGTKIDGSDAVFTYNFIDLKIPVTSIGDSREVPKGTEYTILNDYPGDDDIHIFYTLDGTDPTVSETRKVYNGETLKIDSAVTVKAVYYHNCGRCVFCRNDDPLHCENPCYGEVGTYRYTVPSSSGGGGTGGGGGGGSSGGESKTVYSITVLPDDNGTITPSVTSSEAEKVITIEASPKNGYIISEIKVTDETGKAIAITEENGKYSFTMPASPVVISGRFTSRRVTPADTGVDKLLNTDEHILYIRGFDTGFIGPNAKLTRAETAMMLYRLLREPKVAKTQSFDDVNEAAWYYEPVTTLASLGIVNGYGNGNFGPTDPITRAQFVAMTIRFAEVQERDCNFTDVPPSYWAAPAIGAANAYGWVDGYDDGLFHPEDTILRSQAAAILNRMLGRSADRRYVTNNWAKLNQFPDLQNPSEWYFYEMVEASNGHEHIYVDGIETWTSHGEK